MWKRDEAVQPPTAANLPAPTARRTCGSVASGAPASAPKPTLDRSIERDVVNIGKSVVIKGELNGSEDLTIEGHVEGKIELQRPRADDRAATARSRPQCSPRRSSCSARSSATSRRPRRWTSATTARSTATSSSPRVAIAEGAHFRGSIDMQRRQRRQADAGRARSSRRSAPSPPRRRAAAPSARPPAAAGRPRTRMGADDRRRETATGDGLVANRDRAGTCRGSLRRRAGRSLSAAPTAPMRLPRPSAAPASNRARAAHQGVLASSSAAAAASRRSCSISVRSSAPTSRSSANSWAARSSSRTSSTTSTGTSRDGKTRRARRRSSRSGSRRQTGSVDGILCWDVFDYLDRLPRRRSPAT